MTINGQGYRETFLRCIAEGYDAASANLNKGETNENPYFNDTGYYEHHAWESGFWWYSANVH